MSVTASLGSFSFLLECDLREALFLLERLGAGRFGLRLAMMAGIVLQLGKTASTKNGSEDRPLQGSAGGWIPKRNEGHDYFSASLRPASRLSKLRMVLSTME